MTDYWMDDFLTPKEHYRKGYDWLETAEVRYQRSEWREAEIAVAIAMAHLGFYNAS